MHPEKFDKTATGKAQVHNKRDDFYHLIFLKQILQIPI